MPQRRILVTGASGALGDATVRSLREQGHLVRGFDCAGVRDASPAESADHVVGNLEDVDALYAAAEGAEVIVHFGAVPDRDDFVRRLVPVNIVGTYNLFEVARMRAIPRVVYASSCRVLGALDWTTETLTLEAGFAPGDHYGLTKATGELLGQLYSHRFSITVLCARIGWFVRNRNEAARMSTSEVGQRMYLSHRDAAAFFELAVSLPLPRFSAVFVTSANAGRPLGDPEPAARVLGYRGRDTWPEGSSWQDDRWFPSPQGTSSLLPDRGEP
ncbi:MAG TPA: NAD(P)-dependent oxidoreductase [Polyangiaceae bacterium]|nr:NAD(P)-dependent oxidoreductase [Polyangiaceae bacterium]